MWETLFDIFAPKKRGALVGKPGSEKQSLEVTPSVEFHLHN